MHTYLAIIVFFTVAVSAPAQENPGQMGTTPQPSATTPSEPKARPKTETQPAPEKPESATVPRASSPASAGSTDSAPALQMANPDVRQLRERIMAALKNNAQLGRANLAVNISDDAIDLTGNADTNRERQIARRIVQSFAGNRKVIERISVAGAAPQSTEAKTQPQIALPENAPGAPKPEGNIETKPPDPSKPMTDPKKDGDRSEKPRGD